MSVDYGDGAIFGRTKMNIDYGREAPHLQLAKRDLMGLRTSLVTFDSNSLGKG